VVGVLDWEMATLGDPLMDLGNSLAYWVEAGDDPVARAIRRQPTHLPGMPTRREVVEHYLGRMGLPPMDFTFYEVYGVFRLAVIAQQIYYRFHHGQTRNPAFRRFWLLAHYLEWRCRRLILRKSAGS
jgi:aminoglycoside phosphotransferase (APT) family kinase protein